MAKYIEREQAIGALIKGFAFHGYAGNTAVNIIKGIPSVDVCPYYIYNKHDRGDDSFCRKFNCEVSADVKPVIWRGCRGMDGIKYYDHNWNEIETPDESKPYADDFELGWAMGLHFGANNPEQAKKYIATSEYWSKRDVKPVVHGEWIDNEYGKPICSVCKKEMWRGAGGQYKPSDYCPSCGARMVDDE